MSVKLFLSIFVSALVLLIVTSIFGNFLEASGKLTRATLGPNGVNGVLAGFFFLFLVLCFSLVPLVVRLFIHLQLQIGNGELALVRFMQAHEQGVVCSFWAFMAVGFGVAFVLGKDDVINSLK